MKGAVCTTAKDKKELIKLLKKMPNVTEKEMEKFKTIKRNKMCDILKDKLLELEKYSTGKNNMTYVIIPANHPTFKFPLNLQDRIEHIKNNVKKLSSVQVDFNVEKKDNGTFNNVTKKEYVWYKLSFKNSKYFDAHHKTIIDLGGKLESNNWNFIID